MHNRLLRRMGGNPYGVGTQAPLTYLLTRDDDSHCGNSARKGGQAEKGEKPDMQPTIFWNPEVVRPVVHHFGGGFIGLPRDALHGYDEYMGGVLRRHAVGR